VSGTEESPDITRRRVSVLPEGSVLAGGECQRKAMGHNSTLRGRALAFLLAGGLLLVIAIVGVPGHFNPEACTNDVLSGPPGVAGWTSVDHSSGFSVGYACELGYADGSTEQMEHTARWPLIIGGVGIALLLIATGTWVQSRVRAIVPAS
jgi:hypothetical protein